MNTLQLHERTVYAVFTGSDGDATKALFQQLERIGPAGVVAVNLFRAQKNSTRAKVYRGGQRGQPSYKAQAYDRKNWALQNLDTVLAVHGAELGIVWGWRPDETTIGYPWVLYVEIPTGQCSFHSAQRGAGRAFAGEWDGRRDVTASRIIKWCAQLLTEKAT